MSDLVSFALGSLFTLVLGYLCFRIAFWLVRQKEEQEMRTQEKRRLIQEKKASGGAVVKPKTLAQKEYEKDETNQAIEDIIRSS